MSQILLLIGHRPNQKLLKEWLRPWYHVTAATETSALESTFDLCILDGPMLDRCLPLIQQRRTQVGSVLLPFLLITSREDLGLASRHLWRSVDEIVVQPVQRVELQARVEVLLRARELSRLMFRQAQILEMICVRVPLEVVLEAIGRFVQEGPDTRDRWPDQRPDVLENRGAMLASLAIDQHRFDLLRRHQLSLLAEGMGDGVIAATPDGQILVFNPAARRLLGLPTDGTPSPSQLPEALTSLLVDMASTNGGSAERLHLHMGGRDLNVLVSPLGSDRWKQGAIALIRDTTAETQYRRLQEKFIANTSHELRGPLATISVSLEALRDGLVPPHQRTRHITAVLEEVLRLRRLSEDIIGLSTIDQGAAELHLISFDLSLLLEAVEIVWGARFEQAGVTLKAEYQPLFVYADYDRVEQVVGNLLDNAIRHTPQGGAVTLWAVSTEEVARIGVQDTGHGIAPEHLPLIWDRFYKVDQARTKAPGTGSGLGLSIVQELVDRMGGTVFAQSQPGQGTTIGFTLPLTGETGQG